MELMELHEPVVAAAYADHLDQFMFETFNILTITMYVAIKTVLFLHASGIVMDSGDDVSYGYHAVTDNHTALDDSL